MEVFLQVNLSTMASSMKAVRFHAAKDIRVDEVPVPQVKKGWVK